MGTVESALVHFMSDDASIEFLDDKTSSEEDSKEDPKEEENSKEESDKFYHLHSGKSHILSIQNMILLHLLMEHQCGQEVDSPPPELLFS